MNLVRKLFKKHKSEPDLVLNDRVLTEYNTINNKRNTISIMKNPANKNRPKSVAFRTSSFNNGVKNKYASLPQPNNHGSKNYNKYSTVDGVVSIKMQEQLKQMERQEQMFDQESPTTHDQQYVQRDHKRRNQQSPNSLTDQLTLSRDMPYSKNGTSTLNPRNLSKKLERIESASRNRSKSFVEKAVIDFNQEDSSSKSTPTQPSSLQQNNSQQYNNHPHINTLLKHNITTQKFPNNTQEDNKQPNSGRPFFTNFDRRCKILLDHKDRCFLFNSIYQYKITQDINLFLDRLASILNCPIRMELVDDLREFISGEDLEVFDRKVPFKGQGSRVSNLLSHTPCRSINGEDDGRLDNEESKGAVVDGYLEPKPARTRKKYANMLTNGDYEVKIVRLERPHKEGSLGVKLWRGLGSSSSVYVSDVLPGSVAAQRGLQPGDSILDINDVSVQGSSLEDVVRLVESLGSLRLHVLRFKEGSVVGGVESRGSLSSAKDIEYNTEKKNLVTKNESIFEKNNIDTKLDENYERNSRKNIKEKAIINQGENSLKGQRRNLETSAKTNYREGHNKYNSIPNTTLSEKELQEILQNRNYTALLDSTILSNSRPVNFRNLSTSHNTLFPSQTDEMRSPNRVRTSSSHYNITHPNNYNPPHIYNNLSEKNNGNSRKPNYPINYPYNNANRLYKTTSQNIEPFSNRKTKTVVNIGDETQTIKVEEIKDGLISHHTNKPLYGPSRFERVQSTPSLNNFYSGNESRFNTLKSSRTLDRNRSKDSRYHTVSNDFLSLLKTQHFNEYNKKNFDDASVIMTRNLYNNVDLYRRNNAIDERQKALPSSQKSHQRHSVIGVMSVSPENKRKSLTTQSPSPTKLQQQRLIYSKSPLTIETDPKRINLPIPLPRITLTPSITITTPTPTPRKSKLSLEDFGKKLNNNYQDLNEYLQENNVRRIQVKNDSENKTQRVNPSEEIFLEQNQNFKLQQDQNPRQHFQTPRQHLQTPENISTPNPDTPFSSPTFPPVIPKALTKHPFPFSDRSSFRSNTPNFRFHDDSSVHDSQPQQDFYRYYDDKRNQRSRLRRNHSFNGFASRLDDSLHHSPYPLYPPFCAYCHQQYYYHHHKNLHYHHKTPNFNHTYSSPSLHRTTKNKKYYKQHSKAFESNVDDSEDDEDDDVDGYDDFIHDLSEDRLYSEFKPGKTRRKNGEVGMNGRKNIKLKQGDIPNNTSQKHRKEPITNGKHSNNIKIPNIHDSVSNLFHRGQASKSNNKIEAQTESNINGQNKRKNLYNYIEPNLNQVTTELKQANKTNTKEKSPKNTKSFFDSMTSYSFSASSSLSSSPSWMPNEHFYDFDGSKKFDFRKTFVENKEQENNESESSVNLLNYRLLNSPIVAQTNMEVDNKDKESHKMNILTSENSIKSKKSKINHNLNSGHSTTPNNNQSNIKHPPIYHTPNNRTKKRHSNIKIIKKNNNTKNLLFNNFNTKTINTTTPSDKPQSDVESLLSDKTTKSGNYNISSPHRPYESINGRLDNNVKNPLYTESLDSNAGIYRKDKDYRTNNKQINISNNSSKNYKEYITTNDHETSIENKSDKNVTLKKKNLIKLKNSRLIWPLENDDDDDKDEENFSDDNDDLVRKYNFQNEDDGGSDDEEIDDGDDDDVVSNIDDSFNIDNKEKNSTAQMVDDYDDDDVINDNNDDGDDDGNDDDIGVVILSYKPLVSENEQVPYKINNENNQKKTIEKNNNNEDITDNDFMKKRNTFEMNGFGESLRSCLKHKASFKQKTTKNTQKESNDNMKNNNFLSNKLPSNNGIYNKSSNDVSDSNTPSNINVASSDVSLTSKSNSWKWNSSLQICKKADDVDDSSTQGINNSTQPTANTSKPTTFTKPTNLTLLNQNPPNNPPKTLTNILSKTTDLFHSSDSSTVSDSRKITENFDIRVGSTDSGISLSNYNNKNERIKNLTLFENVEQNNITNKPRIKQRTFEQRQRELMMEKKKNEIEKMKPEKPPRSKLENVFEVFLVKNHSKLGLVISGGIESKTTPMIVIDSITPNSSASFQGQLKEGMVLMGVDDETLVNVNHKEAVAKIKSSFINKKNPLMKLVVKRDR